MLSILKRSQRHIFLQRESVSFFSTMNFYDFEAEDIDGNVVPMSKFRDQICVVVNVASKCGCTKRDYEGLKQLDDVFHPKIKILAFPCNQFGNQEPGTSEEIKQFISKYDIRSMTIFKKIDVKGKNIHPLFEYLTENSRGLLGMRGIKWNFTKFLIDQSGNIKERLGSTSAAMQLEESIRDLLEKA